MKATLVRRARIFWREIMTIRIRTHLLLLTAAIALATCLAGTRQQAAITLAQSPALTEPMPVDPQITMGKFANGLRYYIRANKKPEKREELRLVVKAGSILEDDDQQGLAHLVEHMAIFYT
jgi:zinc protease